MIQLEGEAEVDHAVAGEWEMLTCMFRQLIAAPAKFEAKCVTSGTHRWAVLDAP
jgi:hypothetical protein